MTTIVQSLKHPDLLGTAGLLALGVLLLLPALLFSDFMPAWAPPAAIVGLLVIFGFRTLTTGRFIGQTPVDGLLLLLLVSLGISLWGSQELAVSLPRTYAFVAALALFWLVAAQANMPWLSWSGWVLLLASLGLAGLILLGTDFRVAKFSFVDQEIYQELPGGWHPFWNSEGFNPNLSAGLLALFWPPAVALIWFGINWQQRDFAKLVAVVLSVLLLLNQSRGALIGIILALPIMTLLHNRRWRWFWLVVLILSAIGIYLIGPALILSAFLGENDILTHYSSLRGRYELWERALNLIRDFPLTGVGLGMVEPAIKSLYPTEIIEAHRNFKHVHNIYLQAGAELGLLGFVAHLALYLSLFYLLWRRAQDHQAGYYRGLALGLLGTLVVFLTHGFFEVITYAPRAAIIVWGLFGLMVAVATRSIPQQDNT